jgi:hypothetical protein
MRLIFAILTPLALMLLNFSGCSSRDHHESNVSGLELQTLQKKEFDCSKRNAFTATMTVLQDLGYSVKAANYEAGHLLGSRSKKASSRSNGISSAAALIASGGILGIVLDTPFVNKSTNLEVTAYLEEVRTNKTSIRLNFASHAREQQLYEEIFSRIREVLFLKKNT